MSDRPIVAIGPIERYEEAPVACPLRSPSLRGGTHSRRNARTPAAGASVEHVGSTAVPGCAGKGVADLMIPYRDEQLEPIKRMLEELGFQRQSTQDTFCEDRPMRVGCIERKGERFRLHIHARARPWALSFFR